MTSDEEARIKLLRTLMESEVASRVVSEYKPSTAELAARRELREFQARIDKERDADSDR